MTEKQRETRELFKQAFYEAGKEKGYTWMLSGKPGEMKAHCSHCGGAAPTDENGKTKLIDDCPHCGERMFHKEQGSIDEPQEPQMWWEEATCKTFLRYKCKRCGFELERRYNRETDYGGGMVTCTCGSFDLDPHPLWPRVGWRNGVDPHVDLEEYFETAPVEED